VPRAQCLLPDGPNYRRDGFLAGLREAGFDVVPRVDRPGRGDILVIWNRSASRELDAQRFEYGGARVLVCENGYLGKNWNGHRWYALAWGHHSGAGIWPDGGAARWDSWGVGLAPWRQGGSETVILAQRGIGEPGIASPVNWAQSVQRRIGGRIRQHPGATESPPVSLADDLADAGSVVTFHSSGALLALTMGVPVWYDFDRWVGAGAARPLSEFGGEPKLDDVARLETMRRLAWAMWTADEIRDGTALKELACMS